MKHHPHSQRGLALIAVLWLVAALSLLVGSLLNSVRGEIRTTRQLQNEVQAQAWGDAIVLLTLQQLQAAGQTQWSRPARFVQRWNDQDYDVQLHPANGWIDPNHAPASLLANLLLVQAGLTAEDANALAERMVQTREITAAGISGRFDDLPDLLRVPGLGLDTFAKLACCLGFYGDGDGRVNPIAAPLPVLKALAPENAEKLQPIIQLQERLMSQPASLETAATVDTADTSFINPQHIHQNPQSTVRLSVRVGDWVRIWWVQLNAPTAGLPWRVDARQTLPSPSTP